MPLPDAPNAKRDAPPLAPLDIDVVWEPEGLHTDLDLRPRFRYGEPERAHRARGWSHEER
jgi:hypothetical protein